MQNHETKASDTPVAGGDRSLRLNGRETVVAILPAYVTDLHTRAKVLRLLDTARATLALAHPKALRLGRVWHEGRSVSCIVLARADLHGVIERAGYLDEDAVILPLDSLMPGDVLVEAGLPLDATD